MFFNITGVYKRYMVVPFHHMGIVEGYGSSLLWYGYNIGIWWIIAIMGKVEEYGGFLLPHNHRGIVVGYGGSPYPKDILNRHGGSSISLGYTRWIRRFLVTEGYGDSFLPQGYGSSSLSQGCIREFLLSQEYVRGIW